jgi:translation initiation factor 1 (eIF-1/SUI1)
MDSNLDFLRGKIRELMNEHADYVATGSALDWADYRHKVGVIEGLAKAERELLDLADRLKEQD